MTEPAAQPSARRAAPYVLLAALAWSMAADGATGGRDLLIVIVILGAAAVTAGARPRWSSRRLDPSTVAFLLLLSWLFFRASRSGLSLESARLSLVLFAVYLTVASVVLLDGADRDRLLGGLVVVGTLHGTVAVVTAIADMATGGVVALHERATSFIGYANGLGVFLVATAVLTTRELGRRVTPIIGCALSVQALALLLTGGRFAIIAGLCLLVWYGATRGFAWLLVPWALLATLVVGVRFVTAPATRLRLWIAALERIAEQPVYGHGPSATILDRNPLAVATTHAHNEPVQIILEYGVVGLALAIAALVLAVRSALRQWAPDRLRSWRDGADPFLVAGALVLLASGLVDFTLRITAVAIITAVLVTAALAPSPVRRWPSAEPGVARTR